MPKSVGTQIGAHSCVFARVSNAAVRVLETRRWVKAPTSPLAMGSCTRSCPSPEEPEPNRPDFDPYHERGMAAGNTPARLTARDTFETKSAGEVRPDFGRGTNSSSSLRTRT